MIHGKLFVGNLNYRVTKADLEALFSRFGTVVSVRYKAKSGHAFVEMQSPAGAEKAVAELDGTLFQERKITVGPEVSRRQAKTLASAKRLPPRKRAGHSAADKSGSGLSPGVVFSGESRTGKPGSRRFGSTGKPSGSSPDAPRPKRAGERPAENGGSAGSKHRSGRPSGASRPKHAGERPAGPGGFTGPKTRAKRAPGSSRLKRAGERPAESGDSAGQKHRSARPSGVSRPKHTGERPAGSGGFTGPKTRPKRASGASHSKGRAGRSPDGPRGGKAGRSGGRPSGGPRGGRR